MKKSTSSGLIASVLAERQSLLLGLAAFGMSSVYYIIAKASVVPSYIFCFVVIALLSIIYVLYESLRRSSAESANRLPSLLAVVPTENSSDQITLLLEPSDLFGMFSRVSIYHRYKDSEYEILIAYGNVVNVQSDRKIQVLVDDWSINSENYLAPLRNQNSSAMLCTIVRPSAPREKTNKKVGLSHEEIDTIMAQAMRIHLGSGDQAHEQ